jgi:hypothetical protein
MTTLAILSALGAAIGFSSYDRGQDDVRNFAMAGGVWGVLSTIIAFALGGWVTARSSAVRGGDNGMLNGALVAAVAIPLILFMVGSAATAMSAAEVANDRDLQASGQQDTDSAVAASARIGDAGDAASANAGNNTVAAPDAERARRAGSRTAWGTLATMVLAVAAAATSGLVSARHDDDNDYRDARRGRGDQASVA